jgi:glc operon protein GlcG
LRIANRATYSLFRYSPFGCGQTKEEIMRIHTTLLAVTALAFTLSSALAATTYDGNGQVPEQFRLSGKAAERQHDFLSINADTAEKLAKACEAIARKNNSQVVVVVLDPQGLMVHMHRMDGEGWIQINATEQKARTALRTRAPSRVLNNRNVVDPFTNRNMAGYGLTTQEGGLPIIVNGQLIGAIGVGGIPPAERNATYGEEMCARDALEQVIGPQPPLLPDLAAQRRNNPQGAGGGAGQAGRGAPNQ